MNIEILWCHEKTDEFLRDVKTFARGLDFYQVAFDLGDDTGKYVVFDNSGYQILQCEHELAFACPYCGEKKFELLIGELHAKPALGLACNNCQTYGAVFPQGLY